MHSLHSPREGVRVTAAVQISYMIKKVKHFREQFHCSSHSLTHFKRTEQSGGFLFLRMNSMRRDRRGSSGMYLTRLTACTLHIARMQTRPSEKEYFFRQEETSASASASVGGGGRRRTTSSSWATAACRRGRGRFRHFPVRGSRNSSRWRSRAEHRSTRCR